MPAGALLSQNCQVELGGVLTGKGTVYMIGDGQIGGLGVPAPKTHDVDLGHAAGAYLGRDYTGTRTLTVPYFIFAKNDPPTAWARFQTLSGLWAASQTDVPLHLQVAGVHLAVNGRPRGLIENLDQLWVGYVSALATFVCGDPTLLKVPGAPTIGTATAGAGSATATWAAPASNGGSPITGYAIDLYRASDSAYAASGSVSAPTTTYTFTGLTAGVAVFAKVYAQNGVGFGPTSAASNAVTPT